MNGWTDHQIRTLVDAIIRNVSADRPYVSDVAASLVLLANSNDQTCRPLPGTWRVFLLPPEPGEFGVIAYSSVAIRMGNDAFDAFPPQSQGATSGPVGGCIIIRGDDAAGQQIAVEVNDAEWHFITNGGNAEDTLVWVRIK